MTDKYAPPAQMWTAAQIARLFGYKSAQAWAYHAKRAGLQPWTYHGTAAMWRAQDVRDAVKSGRV